ncbi:TraY domain-containing protein [Pantoea allii]|uniref:Relaxosome protein TraY n=1 Tax=Pantoea allii TaxID=574096 RepID=A0A2V2BCE0_9GAMM|nr:MULTISPECIES: TraY domain-containing protein [Pantoea]OWY74711.1 hypothetical protein CDN97_22120 [Pantoea sp. AMG 501]PWK94527.1 TraY domain-containing protein [Pantoea allii]
MVLQPVDNKSVLIHLPPGVSRILSKAARRSGRSNTREALVRLEDHLITVADLATPGKSILINLPPELEELLTQAAKQSGRSNAQETLIRLEDHLKKSTDLATPGRCFEAEKN